jgi:hypothetical protein
MCTVMAVGSVYFQVGTEFLAYFQKMKVGLSYHQPLCLCVCLSLSVYPQGNNFWTDC